MSEGNGFRIRWADGVVSIGIRTVEDDEEKEVTGLLTVDGALQLAKVLVAAASHAAGVGNDVEE